MGIGCCLDDGLVGGLLVDFALDGGFDRHGRFRVVQVFRKDFGGIARSLAFIGGHLFTWRFHHVV